jgi:DNA-binding NtrC family response regulator
VQRVVLGCEWSILPVRTLQEAMRALAHQNIPIVICEPRFPGGDWRDLLSHLNSQKSAPNLVLVAPHDAKLAAELMNLGGYDVLEKPLDRAECLHVFASARCNWNGRVQPAICVTWRYEPDSQPRRGSESRVVPFKC